MQSIRKWAGGSADNNLCLVIDNLSWDESGLKLRVVQKEWSWCAKASASVDCGSGNDTSTRPWWYDRWCIGKIAKVSQGSLKPEFLLGKGFLQKGEKYFDLDLVVHNGQENHYFCLLKIVLLGIVSG